MNKKVVFLMLWLQLSLQGQTITGTLTGVVNQEIKIEAFEGLKTYTVAKTTTNDKGEFTLRFSTKDYGVGALVSADNKPVFVILSNEDIVLKGTNFYETDKLSFTKSSQNIAFERYAKEQPKREQALSAWSYLKKIYTADSLFIKQPVPSEAIATEMNRLYNESTLFVESLPLNSYVRWFLPTRKLVSSVANVAQYRTEEVPQTITAFRNLDYTDERLYKSGLFKDAIEAHFWLIENSGKPLDQVYAEMKISIDAMMEKLITNEKKLNEVTDYLFDVLERHSLFEASEYLAVQVLNQSSCTLDSNLARQLETYRAMKKGNTAPDINFSGGSFSNPTQAVTKLSAVKSPYTLVVFGGSWCQKCTEEVPEITKYYDSWKAKGVEVLLVAMEENKADFTKFTGNLPFPSYSDFKKWNSPIVTNYYVFSTPTMFLLDDKRKILLRPNSVKQVNAWVEYQIK